MYPCKLPGVDGMPALFYQEYWSIVGDDVVNLSLKILNDGGSVKDFNHTLIALIPKKKDPILVSDYRPFSLCNVLYKIIAKALASRLNSQRFPSSFSGIKVGRPLSPYLFLICVEGLSALLRKAELNEDIHDISVADEAPSINHLFFADDSLIFGDASIDECKRLKEVLSTYEAASGQKVSYEKSAISFSPSTSEEGKTSISREIGMKLVLGRDRNKIFRKVKDWIQNRVDRWHGNLLSMAGKEVLIKAVLQAIPSYAVSVFHLSSGLCSDLNKLVARYWWG
ncbi:hypothetical protein M0R45_001339 [Rubus argutus]|uniref:Reverse transcriptase domain-containing protein n=1 Tax=Rubus argutus TaxID=59490 RepID=A0AAW1VMI6_RUBAR